MSISDEDSSAILYPASSFNARRVAVELLEAVQILVLQVSVRVSTEQSTYASEQVFVAIQGAIMGLAGITLLLVVLKWIRNMLILLLVLLIIAALMRRRREDPRRSLDHEVK
ncbi:MAG: hypothetical protein M1816_002203 [Peltula sp. TS41687]|nr:MAG: hypothetical protein M1816_002203 [Peltula sp. TS41687]